MNSGPTLNPVKLVNIAELKSHLSEVIAKVSESGNPVAKLVPFSEEEECRNTGFGKHLVMTNISDSQHQVEEPVDPEILEGFYP